MSLFDTILIYGVFAAFIILVFRNFFNNLVNAAETERKSIRTFHKRGLVCEILITALNFTLFSLFFYVAGKYALLSIFWYTLSMVFALFGALCFMTAGYGAIHKDKMPKLYKPIEIGQEFIRKRVKRRKKLLIFKLVMLVIWVYSWFPVIAQPS